MKKKKKQNKKIRLDIISLLLVVLCSTLLGMVGVGISLVFLIIYLKTTKEKYLAQKIFIILCFLGIVMAFGGLSLIENMDSHGIDSIGEALVYAGITNLGRLFLVVCPLLIAIIDNRKFIFRKKVLVGVLIFIIAVLISIFIFKLLTTIKVSKDIPTVSDFEKELIERGFLTDKEKYNYRLYGIKKGNEKAIKLKFNENSNEQYPLYVYSVINYDWIIYYANGEIYAVRGEFWDEYTAFKKNNGYNEEKIIWNYRNDIISERDEMIVYNPKINRYEKGKTITYTGFDYYSKDHNKEDSIFIDIPCIESWGSEVKKVDRIDKKTLNTINLNEY